MSAALAEGFDLRALPATFYEDPYPTYRALRETAPVRRMPDGSLFLTRPTLGSYTATREELLERGSSVLGDIAAGRLDVEVGGRYPLAEAATAYDDLEARRTTGKLVLNP